VQTRQVLDSQDFRRLVVRRWSVSLLLTAALLLVYYGFILLVALDKALLARRIGAGVTTLGIPLAVLVIVVAWALTAIYVWWANRAYDPAVDRLKKRLEA
jgi:uncharacterized membrane protein (DUF485 family)